MDHKKPIDWPAIESDWVKTSNSICGLADWYGVSEAAIRKKAKQQSWPDRMKLSAQTVRTTDGMRTDTLALASIDPTDPQQIVGRGQNLIVRLLDELDASTTHRAELAEMIEAHEDDPRRRAAMLKAVSLPERADVARALALAFKTWCESNSPDGKKARRQARAEALAATSIFSPRPRLAVNND